ncbi:MAG: hypothetical protein WC047_05235 [Kiritimatiellales bacterium]
MVSTLPKAEGGNFETTPAGTFIARCYRFIDLGSHEQMFQGESKGLKRLVMIGFELPTELMTTGDYAGKPFSIHKRYTFSTHEKANMRKDLESWRGKKFNDSDFGPGGFDVRNLLGVPSTLSIAHSEKDGSTYANITGIGQPMKGIAMPAQINPNVFLSLEPHLFDREVYESLSDKLKTFISESPEYRSLIGGKPSQNGYAEQRGVSNYHAPLDASREIETAGPREFAPLDDDFADQEIPF